MIIRQSVSSVNYLTAGGQTVMENRYRYDAVDNILGITECCQPNVADKTQQGEAGRKEFAYV